jgi:hypothetical protein
MIHIEPLGTDIILPAFVIGYDVTWVSYESLDAIPDLPDWLLAIDQQAGGLSMSYPSVAGAVLRLTANRGRGFTDLNGLIRGLTLMAEDPDLAALEREYPVLRRAVLTSGNPYDPSTLSELERLLSASLRLPPLAGGIEAFLRFAPCDAEDYFGGWKMLRCSAIGQPRPIYSDRVNIFEQSNIGQLKIEDTEDLSASSLRELREFGRRIGLDEPPGVFLLWESSD